MARSRNIKPGFFLNDELAQIDPLGRLLFAGLWTIADREGRLEDRPLRIKAQVLPYDSCNVDTLLNELHQGGFITRYKHASNSYIQIINFSKHQNPHKNEAESIIPPPEEPAPDIHSTSTVQVPDMHSTNRADSLNLIPDSLNPITTTDSLDFDPKEIESRSRQLVEKFEKGFGRLLNEIEAAKVVAWSEEFDPELVEYALETAVLGNNRSCKYIGGILNNWHDKGVKCVQDAQDLERKYQARKKSVSNDRASPEPVKQFYVPPEVLSDLMGSG